MIHLLLHGLAIASTALAAPWTPASAGLAAKFVEFPPITFQMGNAMANAPGDERPHPVRLTRPFAMQATELTQLQYFLVTGENPAHHHERRHCPKEHETRKGVELCPNHPVERVSWETAQEFLRRLNALSKDFVYRLPTEAEWELVARAVRGSPATSWFLGNSRGQTQPVGRKSPSPQGVHDLLGNVAEWVSDYYGAYGPGEAEDPAGPADGFGRVVRGGSFDREMRDLRVPRRTGISPQAYSKGLGFRLVRLPR